MGTAAIALWATKLIVSTLGNSLDPLKEQVGEAVGQLTQGAVNKLTDKVRNLLGNNKKIAGQIETVEEDPADADEHEMLQTRITKALEKEPDLAAQLQEAIEGWKKEHNITKTYTATNINIGNNSGFIQGDSNSIKIG